MEAAIRRFLSGSGSGSGSGYGSGDGSGSGSGSGSGYGSGDGSGSGYGSGDGYGDGYGSGYGSGDGYGDGYGSGDGYGDGYGSGDGDGYGSGYGYGEKLRRHNGRDVYYIDGIPCAFVSVHGMWAVVDTMSRDDFSTTRAFIAKQDRFFAHGETIKEAFSAVLEKVMDNMDFDEKKRQFLEAFPEYETPYKTADFYSWHHIVTGSCNLGRKQFAQERGIDLDGSMTVKEFIDLTKSAYGGDMVASLAELYR